MKAWLCEHPTGPDALVWRDDLPTPEPKAGELRVAIGAASLNFPDLLIVRNQYQIKPPLPFVPGAEFAGVVEACGDGVDGFRPGDRIATFAGTGGFASHACFDAHLALALPDDFPLEHAAAFICTYATTHHALLDRAHLRAGETVLVLGAAGGVGSAAIQVAKAAGAQVIAAASSEDKCAACRELGADATIDYGRSDLRDSIRTLTAGRGPDVVYDPVGGDLAEPAFRSIAWRGRYLVVGFAGGRIPSLPLNLALLKGASIVGVFWGEFAKREPERNAQALRELLGWYRQGRVRPLIDACLPLRQLPQAYERMGSRQVRGKLVLTP